jgi:hypothetical protein
MGKGRRDLDSFCGCGVCVASGAGSDPVLGPECASGIGECQLRTSPVPSGDEPVGVADGKAGAKTLKALARATRRRSDGRETLAECGLGVDFPTIRFRVTRLVGLDERESRDA